ncbi:MAG TPA: hypothetical protein VNO70_04690, partial [Blastocatellia bacterium]|nr:hypothetical protein [Blastocatellia bacterium]
MPSSSSHTAVRVNAPKMLLSPALNAVVTATVALPPQHASGNALVELAPNVLLTGIVACTRFFDTGV